MTYEAIIEQLDVDATHIPNGLAVTPTLVSVDSSGRIQVQVANFMNDDLHLPLRTFVATVTNAVTEHHSRAFEATWQEMQAA